ncbi:MAG: DUF2334 domain-containing protein [Alphaproteobacteria bacterium]|nr:MAG: DUF2334 domain-containing protein [Alphaproteobacteria bacterium]
MAAGTSERQATRAAAAARDRRILVSLHDVTPAHFARLRDIVATLERIGVGSRFAMLVVPDFWSRWPLPAHRSFVDWLREQAGRGAEILLHGYTHRDDRHHRHPWHRLRAHWLTAGEGEFLGLDGAEARRRLDTGRTMLEDLLDGPIDGFVAPAWLYGPDSRQALAAAGFEIAEGRWSVWSPRRGRTLARGPVVAYAGRTRGRLMGSLLWSHLAGPLLAGCRVLRLAIHPHDFDHVPLRHEIERFLRRQMETRRCGRYRDLLTSGA